jgi:hypothetical protein
MSIYSVSFLAINNCGWDYSMADWAFIGSQGQYTETGNGRQRKNQ